MSGLGNYDGWKLRAPEDDGAPQTCEHGADLAVCPVCNGECTVAECPRCHEEQLDYDGFGVVYHPTCGYCRHLSRDNGVCNYCGEMPAVEAKRQEER